MNEVKKACDILESGGVVGLPTETVYGLAASIYSKEGLEKIFSTKERPFFDPLIIHVSSIEQAKSLTTNWNPVCEKLATNLWPGPMTMILDKADIVDDLITAGLTTVGIRFPSHPIAKELISKLGHPIAAPSANKFKRVSPTNSQHVKSEFPSLMVLEGGESEIGIESTILRPLEKEVIIYRPGTITPTQISKTLGEHFSITYHESPIAPGHLKEHYRPQKPVILKILEDDDQTLTETFTSTSNWTIPKNSQIAARLLYGKLREMDQESTDAIVISIESDKLEDENFRGILNRLYKAASLKSKRIKSEY